MKNGLKGVKNVLNRYWEAKNRQEVSSFVPFSAQVEVTTKCNLRCAMCEHSHWTEKAEDLSLENFKRIVDNNPFLLTLNLTGIGESLLNPEFLKMLEYAKEKGIFVWFNDNMALMDEAMARKVIDSGVDVLAISLDGATSETFEAIRKGADFNQVMQNIKGLVMMKKLLKSKTPKLFISFVVMPSNYREMPAVARIAQGLGIENVTYVGALEFEQNREMGFNRINLKDYEKYEAEALEIRAKYGVDMRMPAKRQKPMPYSSCPLPWESLYINHKGQVLPCCFATQRNDPALYKASVLGNAIEEPIEKIWNNEKFRALRRGLLSNQPVPICKGCAKVKGY
jgi:MoaA/NifB/PqqE/SkfB family radical SAM enzyme